MKHVLSGTKVAKAQALQAKINRSDTEIDSMVYALYGLSKEEVAVVEGREMEVYRELRFE
jgi:hypothetical protein